MEPRTRRRDGTRQTYEVGYVKRAKDVRYSGNTASFDVLVFFGQRILRVHISSLDVQIHFQHNVSGEDVVVVAILLSK